MKNQKAHYSLRQEAGSNVHKLYIYDENVKAAIKGDVCIACGDEAIKKEAIKPLGAEVEHVG